MCQVASYGGQLKFTVGYMSGDDRTVVDKPNVILHVSGFVRC